MSSDGKVNLVGVDCKLVLVVFCDFPDLRSRVLMALPSTNTNNCIDNVSIAANVFAEYGDFIHAVIRYRAGNKDQIDDLFQDFFLSLIAKPIPGSVQNVKSYLYRAITNDIIDCTRRVRRHQEYMHKYGESFNCSINKSCPENALVEEEQTRKMFELLRGRLPNSEAQAITMRYRDNFNTKEIAKKMGLQKATVRRYISVGLKKLRQSLPVKKDS